MTATEPSSADIQREAEHERAELTSTLDKLRENLKPSNMVDEVMASAKLSSQDITDRVWQTARNNPVPAAIIGLGLAMLLGVGQTVRSRSATKNSKWLEEDRFAETSSSRAIWRSNTPAVSRVASARQQAGSVAEAASARASAAMSQIADSTKVLRYRAANTINSYATGARDGLGATKRDNVMAQHSQSRDPLTSKLSNLLDEQPLVLAALGIAVGAAIGAAIPSTDTESRWMGEASGSVKRTAQELAQDQYAQLKAKAGETLEDLKQTAADHGVSSENLSGLVQDVSGKVRDAAHSVADSARNPNAHSSET